MIHSNFSNSFEVPAAQEELPYRLQLLEKLLRLIPNVLPVSGEPAGPRFVSHDGTDEHLHRSTQHCHALNQALSVHATKARKVADERAREHAALFEDEWAKMQQSLAAADTISDVHSTTSHSNTYAVSPSLAQRLAVRAGSGKGR